MRCMDGSGAACEERRPESGGRRSGRAGAAAGERASRVGRGKARERERKGEREREKRRFLESIITTAVCRSLPVVFSFGGGRSARECGVVKEGERVGRAVPLPMEQHTERATERANGENSFPLISISLSLFLSHTYTLSTHTCDSFC